jgi:hypothetical protein
MCCCVSSGADEAVILSMRADPNPSDRVRSHSAERTIMNSDANTKTIVASLQSAEVKGRMLRVATPQFIVLDCQVSDIVRKGVEQGPETAGRDRLHFAGGQLLTSPRADSSCASPNRKSSLPQAESRSICSSQVACSRTRIQSSRRRYSFGGKLVMAASISSTRSIYCEFSRRCLRRRREVRAHSDEKRLKLRTSAVLPVELSEAYGPQRNSRTTSRSASLVHSLPLSQAPVTLTPSRPLRPGYA